MAVSGIEAKAQKGADKATETKESKEVYYDTYGREFKLPDFTMNDILEAIPAECFERSALKGYSYVLRDLVLITLNGLAAHYFIPQLPNATLRFAGWMVYAFMQGLFMTGIWVLAHECGHQAFSSSRTINDFTGWVMHSALLVPYFSWQSSHSRHHKGTSNLAKDTVFNPKTLTTILERRGIDPRDFPVDEHGEMSEEVENSLFDMIEDSPLYSLVHLTLQQLFGWILYLFMNVTGQKYPAHSKWAVNHFNPASPFFKKEEYNRILLSDLGILLTFTALAFATKTWGFMNVVCYYGVPYLWVNHWLVMITYLQHTDPALPHYRPGTWNFQRGAAATMDRDFGFIGQHLLHDIIETHVAHHFCSRIPFYNGRKATKAVRKVLGEHYQYDNTNIFLALWRTTRMCQWVADTGDVVFFQNANGLMPKNK